MRHPGRLGGTSGSRPGVAHLQAQPFGYFCALALLEFVSMNHMVLGVESVLLVRCLCYNAGYADTRHERVYSRAGTRVSQQQPLMYTICNILQQLSTTYTVEDETFFSCQ